MSAITISCRTCGDLYSMDTGVQLRECPSCGTVNARPQAEGESLDRLQRATRLRLKGEYEEAESCYRFVLMDYDNEHEALWGKLLCQYGVEFLTDVRTGERRAVVHVPHSRPLELHADFVRACELAPAEVCAQYEAEAAYVDDALAEINRLRDTCPPYDVFVCHKTTPLNGSGYTEDYNRGVQLTRRLEKAGYNVFFAPFADLVPGASYEASLYHALWTSKVMLLISSDPELINSVWVKSEWTRFLEMLDDGEDKHLIPLMYGGMPDSSMPREIRLRGLQNIRMENLDAAELLMSALARHTGRGTAEEQPAPPPRNDPPPQERPENAFITSPAEGGVRIIGYTGPGGEVEIPETIGARRVVAIGDKAFQACALLTDVILPQSVTTIGALAFDGCTSLTSIFIPAGVTAMGSNPFCGCTSLRAITVAADNPAYYVQGGALLSRDGELVTCPAGMKFSSFQAPKAVKRIGDWAFARDPDMMNVRLPEGVREIGANAFCGCVSLTGVQLPEGLVSIGDRAFTLCSSLAGATLPEGVCRVGEEAFGGCGALTGVSLPESLRQIGRRAFRGCGSLTEMTIPTGVAEMGEDAFIGCHTLSLRVFGDSAAHRYALKYSIPHELVRTWEPEANFAVREIEGGVSITRYNGPGGSVDVPPTIGGCRVVEIGRNAFLKCGALTELRIPEGVREVSAYAFRGCENLVEVSLPTGMTTLGAYAFDACRSLPAMTLPEGVTEIGVYAFRGCKGLENVNIPGSVRAIGDYAFDDCQSLQQMHIPAGVTSVGKNPFSGCTALKSITVAENSRAYYIHSGALLSHAGELVCHPAGLKALAYAAPEGVKTVGEYAFSDCESLLKVTLPAGVTSIGDYAFENCDSLTRVSIQEGLLRVENCAFAGCIRLSAMDFPEGVTIIGGGAFQGCTGLSRVTLPRSVENIRREAFKDCPALLLRVHEGSPAHAYARENGLRFELLGGAPAGSPARTPAAPAAAPVRRPVEAQPAVSAAPRVNPVPRAEAASRAASAPKNYTPESCFDVEQVSGGVSIVKYTGTGSEVEIPPTIGGARVVKIGKEAFLKCSVLTTVGIPACVTEIGENPFTRCTALQRITIDEGNAAYYTRDNVLFSRTGELVCYTAGLREKSYQVPSFVKRIGWNAFSCCGSLTEVQMPRGVMSIGAGAFSYCANLLDVHLPRGVARVGDGAFSYCRSLRSVYIPESVKVIEAGAFSYCTSLTEVTLPLGLMYIASGVFGGCTALERVSLPEGVSRIEDRAFFDCRRLTEVNVPEGVTSIWSEAFEDCTGLRTISISASVTEIGDNPFKGCTALQNITVAEANATYCARDNVLMSRKGGLLYYPAAAKAEKYDVPEGVTWIRTEAFADCASLTAVTLPEGVAGIGERAFCGCRALTTLNIPDSVVNIGEKAFEGCDQLTLVVQTGSPGHEYAKRHNLRHKTASRIGRFFGKK